MVMFYFSGTGNSKYVAEHFCHTMDAKCYSIEENADFENLITDNEIIGFCYPIYWSRVPRIMREFVGRYMAALKGKKLIIFCTQQILSGDGARAFYALLPHGYTDVIYAEHFFMPSNIWPITSSETKIKRCAEKANKKLQIVCHNIRAGKVKKRGFSLFSRMLGLIQAPLMKPMEKKALHSVKVSDNCMGCQVCVSVCPMRNFELTDGKITHKHNCTLCNRCVNQCPQKSVTVVFHGKVKKQYKGIKTNIFGGA